ncbi:RsmB/NOP family class I SAM-dependent RNA methyltransferase [Aestuariivirga sp.]|uniref:RsmB/NOP family class I SAM-dependent RNA methyltransferase n=1 Tax=Aestuariivirga sp. TaxID=2650926 RepID=UPI00391C8D94
MRLAGRVSAAIDILAEIFGRHRPASEALKDWGKAHRFAGSSDRHAIGTLVYDVLRRRNSLAFRMGEASPRALALAALHDVWGLSVEAIAAMAGEQHGPGGLSGPEREALSRTLPERPPLHVAGDVPDWLAPSYEKAFGARAAEEAAALARRAPVDLRVNTLKATRGQVVEALSRFGAAEGPISPLAVRIPAPGPDSRNANVEAEPAHGLGWFEVQDAGSQVAALLSGVGPGMSVADLCAGAGGKTLALAALMRNEGKLLAHDLDRFRLRPIFERLTRAGVTNCEVVSAQDEGRLESAGPFDCVVIDAPCSGSGSWRRKPDAKWRLTRKQFEQRLKDQRQVLEKGFELAKPGGTILYITCSVLPEENTEQVADFLKRHPEMKLIPYEDQWARTLGGEAPKSADGSHGTLVLTPAQHDTDGFFIAVLRKGKHA